MKDIIKQYKDSLQKIYDHVGFKEDWVIAPLDDETDKYWKLNDGCVNYADSIDELKNEIGNYYTDEIYKQSFYKKWVYVGEDITMVFCDPHVDGMKWFRLFDNKRQIKK